MNMIKFECFCGEKMEIDLDRKDDPTNMVKCPICGVIHGTYDSLKKITSGKPFLL